MSVWDVTDVTPKTDKRDDRFICSECEKLLKSASAGYQAKQQLFSKTSVSSYISGKRKTPTAGSTTPKRPRLHHKTTPLATVPYSTGPRYFANSRYKQGFKYYLNKGSAFKALRSVLAKKTRSDIKNLLSEGSLPTMKKVSVGAFRNVDFLKIVQCFKTKVPLLYNSIVSSLTKSEDMHDTISNRSLLPVIGNIFATIASKVRPKQASLLQKMNAVQMWRCGCKRSLFANFNRLGICVSEGTMLSTLDKLKSSFDSDLMKWENELQRHAFPNAIDTGDDGGGDDDDDDDDDNDDGASVVMEDVRSKYDSGSSSVTTPVTSPVHEQSSTLESDVNELEDVEFEEELDTTIPHGDTSVPSGYTLCWDNVGKQMKARRQTRNHGNKYKSWALAFVVKNRIPTVDFKDETTIEAKDISVDAFLTNTTDSHTVRERLINIVQRIIVKYMDTFQSVAHIPLEYFPHHYDKESYQKSEMFNIGVIDESLSSTAGVIEILEKLHKYVPRNTDGKPLKLITWGDGLSCERHIDVQNARSNAETPITKLQGLEPAAQEFHKRMLLMQDLMDKLFDGKSAMDTGTLFHLKNVFNQRSVSKNVSETFNYVSDFIKFVTEGYVILFAMDLLQMHGMEELIDDDDKEEVLNSVSETIVDRVWRQVDMISAESQSYCFCQQDLEEDDETMIECDHNECANGSWFHIDCVGIDEDDMPDEWFCTEKCKMMAQQYCLCKKTLKNQPMVECCNPQCKRGQWFHAVCVKIAPERLPSEDELWYCCAACKKADRHRAPGGKVDRKFEYTKLLLWGGLNDMARREAVSHNDGEMMTLYWKMDMTNFFHRNHPKYFILGHRLISALNGFLPERFRQGLIWNRTFNMHGGRGKNDETDLVNEFLNRESKESIRSVGSKTTSQTLERHGKLAGGVGKALQEIYGEMVEGEIPLPVRRTTDQRKQDVKFLTELLKDEKLTQEISGRFHKAFPTLCSRVIIDKNKYISRLKSLAKKLDKAKRVAI